ncbi:hypothetical protein ACIQGO_41830 [Streptomyces shenzhenensis]|uniref:hypothetical protein n=1 Tax=Streptomyces shenzhenensis TaxID=943815 RepID=UPI003814363E
MPVREVAHGGKLLLGGDAGLDRGDLAEPALFLGFLEPVEQVRVDLLQPGQLLGVGPQYGATDAGFSELRRVVCICSEPCLSLSTTVTT